MTTLTPERLEELKRLADAATPGPWHWQTPEPYGGGEVYSTANDQREYICTTSGRAHKNAAFIAAARTTLPELLAEVERLRERERKHILTGGELIERAEKAEAELARVRECRWYYEKADDEWCSDCDFGDVPFDNGGDPAKCKYCPGCGGIVVTEVQE